jgi:hypothetical protein
VTYVTYTNPVTRQTVRLYPNPIDRSWDIEPGADLAPADFTRNLYHWRGWLGFAVVFATAAMEC